MRFDFHWTTEGWRISEANTDVAGGFIEASGVTSLMAAHYPATMPIGDPAGALAEAIHGTITSTDPVGFMHLTCYTEDRQIMLYLARRLQKRTIATCLFNPSQLRWSNGQAEVACEQYEGPLSLVFRFLPAEWLLQFSKQTGWTHFLCGGRTAACNPAYTVLTQSKRFPLVWDQLVMPLPTWRSLLPETRSPHDVQGDVDGEWVLKPALGYEGRDVGLSDVTEDTDWERIQNEARKNPAVWVAQRRFQCLPLETPEGPMYPCVGIYVIEGRAAGAFGRMGLRPLIDDRSREIAVLMKS
jgi:glutathionylspermidine synthase